jgi:hypothetical protein
MFLARFDAKASLAALSRIDKFTCQCGIRFAQYSLNFMTANQFLKVPLIDFHTSRQIIRIYLN